MSSQGRRALALFSWLFLWLSSLMSFWIHKDTLVLVLIGIWSASAVLCVAVSRNHRRRAVLLVVASGLVAVPFVKLVLIAISCSTGRECM